MQSEWVNVRVIVLEDFPDSMLVVGICLHYVQSLFIAGVFSATLLGEFSFRNSLLMLARRAFSLQSILTLNTEGQRTCGSTLKKTTIF